MQDGLKTGRRMYKGGVVHALDIKIIPRHVPLEILWAEVIEIGCCDFAQDFIIRLIGPPFKFSEITFQILPEF